MIKKIKAWIIHKLGGITKKEFKNKARELDKEAKKWFSVVADLISQNEDLKKMMGAMQKSVVTAQSEILLAEHPAWNEDDCIERGKEAVIRNLGKAVYPYAHHTITPDGLYIASVQVLEGDAE